MCLFNKAMKYIHEGSSVMWRTEVESLTSFSLLQKAQWLRVAGSERIQQEVTRTVTPIENLTFSKK